MGNELHYLSKKYNSRLIKTTKFLSEHTLLCSHNHILFTKQSSKASARFEQKYRLKKGK